MTIYNPYKVLDPNDRLVDQELGPEGRLPEPDTLALKGDVDLFPMYRPLIRAKEE